jgi:hypothetical protein
MMSLSKVVEAVHEEAAADTFEISPGNQRVKCVLLGCFTSG